jgi:hypothetical protein
MTRVRAQVNEETSKNQLPWGHTNLIGEVYLNPQTASADKPAASTETPVAVNTLSAPATAMEVEFWRSVKDSNKPEELNAYLNSYPNGAFKSLALGRIAKLQDNGQPGATRNLTTGVDPETFTKDADQTSEDQLGLDRSQRRDVQRRLTGLGFDTKASGKFDDNTRSVIKRWQAQRGYPVSGYLNTLQHKALLGEIVSTRVASADDSSSSGDDESSSGGGRHYRRSGGGGGRHYRGGGGGGLFGHMMGGMFR